LKSEDEQADVGCEMKFLKPKVVYIVVAELITGENK